VTSTPSTASTLTGSAASPEPSMKPSVGSRPTGRNSTPKNWLTPADGDTTRRRYPTSATHKARFWPSGEASGAIFVRGQLHRQKDEDTGATVFDQRGLKSKDDQVTRVVRIPRQLAEQLRKWRAASPRSTSQDFVFVSAAGSPPSDSTVRANFYRARKAAGLNPTMRFHDMRDTHASMLIRDGRPITEIAVRLGHTKKDGSPNPATTLAHYSRLFDAAAFRRRDLRTTGGTRCQPSKLKVDPPLPL
jgi:hypothetical protein